jgi:hypothetical protein
MGEQFKAHPQVRYRVSVEDSVKGVRHTNSTFEMMGGMDEIYLADFQKAQLEFQDWVDRMYPPPNPTS